jgi:hypothetical protein
VAHDFDDLAREDPWCFPASGSPTMLEVIRKQRGECAYFPEADFETATERAMDERRAIKALLRPQRVLHLLTEYD